MSELARDYQAGGQHYTAMEVQPWDVVDTWGGRERVAVYRFGILKYTMRLGAKDDMLQEAEKILHYAQKLVETLKKFQ